MKTSFTESPKQSIDQLVLIALEATGTLFRGLHLRVGKAMKLSPIQIQIILFLYYQAEDNRRLTILAREFKISKATLSESVKNLVFKKLVTRRSVKNDRRSQIINLTARGKKWAAYADQVNKIVYDPIRLMTSVEKQYLLDCLHKILAPLKARLYGEGV